MMLIREAEAQVREALGEGSTVVNLGGYWLVYGPGYRAQSRSLNKAITEAKGQVAA